MATYTLNLANEVLAADPPSMFTEGAEGAGLDTAAAIFEVGEDGEGRFIRGTRTASYDADEHVNSWDTPGEITGTREILALFEVEAYVNTWQADNLIVITPNLTKASGGYNFYSIRFSRDGSFGLFSSVLINAGDAWAPTVGKRIWVRYRFEVSGTQVINRAVWWEDGNPEPGTWDFSRTDDPSVAGPENGYVAIKLPLHYQNAIKLRFLQLETGGGTAPGPGPSNTAPTVEIQEGESATLPVGATLQLSATVDDPEDDPDPSVVWSSDNEAVATVDISGLVTVVGVGTAVITASATDSASAEGTDTFTITAVAGPSGLVLTEQSGPLAVGFSWVAAQGASAQQVKRKKKVKESVPPEDPENPPPPDPENMPPLAPANVQAENIQIGTDFTTFIISGGAYSDPDGGTFTYVRGRAVDANGVEISGSNTGLLPAATTVSTQVPTGLEVVIPQLKYADELDSGPWGSGPAFSSVLPVPEPEPEPEEPPADPPPAPDPEAPPAVLPSPSLIEVPVGADLRTFAMNYPEGQGFRLQPGYHRVTDLVQFKEGQRFFAAEPEDTILSGARLIDDWQSVGNGVWRSTGHVKIANPHGGCQSGTPYCNRPEILWFDDEPLVPVGTLAELVSGKFFFEYSTGFLYVKDDPTGYRTEIPVAQRAFYGTVTNLYIYGLTVEKFGSPAQGGAIDSRNSSYWVLDRMTSRFNSGMGIRSGDRMTMLDVKVLKNGQMGTGGGGQFISVQGGEWGYNNFAGYSQGWESGGCKFANTEDLLVEGVWSHHNDGPGIWTDVNNIRTTHRNNIVEDNSRVGIFHEISYDAEIHDNIVRRNGTGFDAHVFGAGILVYNSSRVNVYNNTVLDNPDGIALLQHLARRSPTKEAHGPWLIRECAVWNNRVRYPTGGHSGVTRDSNTDLSERPDLLAIYGSTPYTENECLSLENSNFQGNDYEVGSMGTRWTVGAVKNWDQWRATGRDVQGTAQAYEP